MGLAAARAAAERLLSALGRDGSTEALDRTFGAVADAWIEKVAKPKNDSWQQQQRRFEMHVFPAWRDRKIAEIKRADVRDLIDGIEGGILPNRVLAQIRTVFRYALSQDWIDASPVEGIKRPNDETPRDRALDMPEIKRIWDAAALVGYPFGLFVRTLLLTGQRRTEVASMRWADVDLEAGTWIIRAQDTKGERKQLVPLAAPTLAILEAAPQLGPYVFTSDGKTHISGFAKGKARLDTFVSAGGEPLDPWTLHDLRRSAATHMVRLGITETIVGRVLNHAPVGVTATVYALHSYAPEKRSALDRWAAEILRSLSGDKPATVVKLRG
jgi:integrase